jgi:glycosyltransferase involved in cell wall biosynthesis
MIKISIITINYNNLIGLKRTLESVTGQSYSNFEYIVIDGGSTDGSKELLEKYADKISYWVSEPDRGIYHAMNKGIEKASGEYLLFMNSGDLFYGNEVLRENIDAIKNVDLIYFDTLIIDENKEYVKVFRSDLSIDYLFNDTIPHQGTFIKKTLFQIVGLYDESLRIVSDWKFFLLALIKYNCSYKKIEKILSIYYLGGMSSKKENQSLNNSERNLVLATEFPMINNLLDNFSKVNRDYKMLCKNLSLYKLSRKYKVLRYFNLINELP